MDFYLQYNIPLCEVSCSSLKDRHIEDKSSIEDRRFIDYRDKDIYSDRYRDILLR